MCASRKRISAVIACYRDAPAVPIMYQRLRSAFQEIGVDYEIIFVNDCSPDNARAVLTALAATDKNLVVINHTRNFGSQAAFTSGMKIATGDAVVLLDGDLQDPPELIPAFYREWLRGATRSSMAFASNRRGVSVLAIRLQGLLSPLSQIVVRYHSH